MAATKHGILHRFAGAARVAASAARLAKLAELPAKTASDPQAALKDDTKLPLSWHDARYVCTAWRI
jgi:hypothetical protein